MLPCIPLAKRDGMQGSKRQTVKKPPHLPLKTLHTIKKIFIFAGTKNTAYGTYYRNTAAGVPIIHT